MEHGSRPRIKSCTAPPGREDITIVALKVSILMLMSGMFLLIKTLSSVKNHMFRQKGIDQTVGCFHVTTIADQSSY